MSWWDDKKLWIYKVMYNNHKHLWEYIFNFIKEHDVKSIFEIGGGMYSPVKKLCTEYIDIDLNKQIPDAIYADFTQMDVTPYIGKYDLVLADDVVEHCSGYEDFLANVVKLKSKFAIVTFFTGLNRRRDKEERIMLPFQGDMIWRNKYSHDGVAATLDALGMQGKYRIFSASDNPKDTLLLITT